MTEAALLTALDCIERPLLREWSVKSTQKGLSDGRWLVSAPRFALGPGPSRVLRAILANAGAPAAGIAELDRTQSQSASVHFGHDPGGGGTILKCYLEFPAEARPLPDLVFLALKWRADGSWTLDRYLDRSGPGWSDRLALVEEVTTKGAQQDALVELMALDPEGTLLEVTDPGTSRRSVDVNLTAIDPRIHAHQSILLRFLGGGEEARAYLHFKSEDRLGHVALGRDRHGTEFATLYHGMHKVEGGL